MDKSVFHRYFRPLLDYGGISAEQAVLQVSCHYIITVLRSRVRDAHNHYARHNGSQSIFEHSDNSYIAVSRQEFEYEGSASPLTSGDDDAD